MGTAWKRIALDIHKQQQTCKHEGNPIILRDGRLICPSCLKTLPLPCKIQHNHTKDCLQ